jgi:hypothetical protein
MAHLSMASENQNELIWSPELKAFVLPGMKTDEKFEGEFVWPEFEDGAEDSEAIPISKSNEHVQKMGNFTANKFAQIVSSLAFVQLILGVIGSIIIGFTPSEECSDLFSSEYCEKDWTTSLTMGLVCLLLNSLVMLSIMMVALYIQERTSTTEE